ncbi:MAG: hypothetical protein GDA42_10380 [Ekhidna sp.]|nr:hypothetical protein [Ekhidna sp.]MBC6410841.1 hypothetical protein [Ekhidna sp.]
MKTMILILSMLFFAIGCSEDGSNEQQKPSIYGTWKLIETYGSDGGSNPQWATIKNGYTYIFNKNETFSSTRFNECTTGIYLLTNNTLTLDFDCNEFDTGVEESSGTFVENYIFENNNLILTPSYLSCFEGCGYKFERTEN